jgi:hypothetical protein
MRVFDMLDVVCGTVHTSATMLGDIGSILVFCVGKMKGKFELPLQKPN